MEAVISVEWPCDRLQRVCVKGTFSCPVVLRDRYLKYIWYGRGKRSLMRVPTRCSFAVRIHIMVMVICGLLVFNLFTCWHFTMHSCPQGNQLNNDVNQATRWDKSMDGTSGQLSCDVGNWAPRIYQGIEDGKKDFNYVHRVIFCWGTTKFIFIYNLMT